MVRIYGPNLGAVHGSAKIKWNLYNSISRLYYDNPNLRLFWLNIKILMAWTQVATQIGVEGSCGRSLGLGIKRCSAMLICAFVSLAFIYSFSINSTTIFLWSVSLLPSVRTIQVELTSPSTSPLHLAHFVTVRNWGSVQDPKWGWIRWEL